MHLAVGYVKVSGIEISIWQLVDGKSVLAISRVHNSKKSCLKELVKIASATGLKVKEIK